MSNLQKLTLAHDVLGDLSRVEIGSGVFGEWIRPLDRPEWAKQYVVRHSYDLGGTFTDIESASAINQDAELQCRDRLNQGPTESQVRAWLAFGSGSVEIAAEAALALRGAARVMCDRERAELFGEDAERFVTECQTRDLPQKIEEQFSLDSICLLDDAHDQLGFVELHFSWTWDEDHLLGLLFHHTECLGATLGGFDDPKTYLKGEPFYRTYL